VGYLTKLPVGTAVKAISCSEENGEQWAYVAAGSRSGYVMAKYLKPAGEADSQQPPQTVAFVLERQLALQLAASLTAALERG
jgi:ABC-type phosphate/phosphonate transport system substrate-binding protein